MIRKIEFEDFESVKPPQEVATAISGLEGWTGASFKFIKYLAKQTSKGVNYWILAEMTLTDNPSTKKIVNLAINGKTQKINEINCHHWRIMGEFIESAPDYVDADFLEKHAEFIAKFYDDVTAEDILDLPIEDILPASAAIRKYIMERLTVKLEKIEKNAEADKAQ